MLRQLDLCSGVGAGFPFAGIRTGGFALVGLCERDEWCQSILKLRYPDLPIIADVKRYDWSDKNKYNRCRDIDIITASPPCQPFSVQGKRLGADDERDCIPAVIKAIASIQPKFFAIENVKGLLSCPYRPGFRVRYFAGILTKFSECGYDAEWIVVSSGHFTSPFLRERLLLVGISRRVEFLSQPCSWSEQIREQLESQRRFTKRGVLESELSRKSLPTAVRLHEPVGVAIGISINRRRREALGNALDPRVAAVALQRILYLQSIGSAGA